MHGFVAMLLLSAAQPPIITIPKDDGKPEVDRSGGPPKIITVSEDGKRTDVVPQTSPDQGKEIADLKAEVARLTRELADERDQQKKSRELHAKELADVRAQLDGAREDLKALEAARRPETTTSRKPLDAAQPPRDRVVPATAPTGPDDNPEKPPADGALVRIRTAEGVRIIVDGVQTKSTGTDRVFVTPPLASGQQYQYTVVAERAVGDGTARVSRTIFVRSGTQVELELYP